MPIYEYECTICHHRLDLLQKVSEEPATDCPECGKAGLQKLISASSFQLKGTGWYVTDFKNKNDASGSNTAKDAPLSPPSQTSTPSTTDTKKT